jgi:rhamnosyltransferase
VLAATIAALEALAATKSPGGKGEVHTCCAPEIDLVSAGFRISSGSLIPMDALEEIGPMDAGLFIDRIDLEWCFRAAAGRAAYGVCGVELQHAPGDDFVPLRVGHWRQMSVHSTTRPYYMVRNSILLYLTPCAPRRWILNDAIRLLGIVLVSLVIALERVRRLRFALKGMADGLRQVRGAMSGRAHRARV